MKLSQVPKLDIAIFENQYDHRPNTFDCITMKRSEVTVFATQARKTLEKAKEYRARAADDDLNEIDRARLLAAARAVEANGREWTQVVRELVR